MEEFAIVNYPDGPISSELQQTLREHDKKLSKSSAFAVLTISSSRLDPDEISKILDIDNSDSLYSGVKSSIIKNSCYWTLSSRKFLESKFLEFHFDWLAGALFDKRLALAKLKSLNCRIKVRGMVKDWTGIAAPEISPNVMSRFSRLEIPIQIVFRYMDLEWEDTARESRKDS